MQEEHIGDASIEGKIKKLVARAREMQPAPAAASVPAASPTPAQPN